MSLWACGTLHTLQALRSFITLQTLWTLRARHTLRSLDRASIHPATVLGIPHLQGVIGLHQVGVALRGVRGQIHFCGDLTAKVDAQAGSTLDALRTLRTLRSHRPLRALLAFWTLRALQAINAWQALDALQALRPHLALGATQ